MAAVVGLGIPPWLELEAIAHPTQRAVASAAFLLAAAAGVWAAVRREPLGARVTTLAYGVAGIGLGLFATDRSLAFLLAYAVGLIGMNVLLYHARAFGPVLAAFRGEDAIARGAQRIVLRSLAVSASALAIAYGGSLALLPVFALDIGVRDPIVALLLAAALVLALLFLTLLPDRIPLISRQRVR